MHHSTDWPHCLKLGVVEALLKASADLVVNPNLPKVTSKASSEITEAPPVFPFLDLWRVIAAAMVLALHFQQRAFLPETTPDLYRLAHLGVVIFFVISGFSVSYSARHRAAQPEAFLISRLSRLYSVVVPVLILALLLDTWAGTDNGAIYPTWQYHKWVLHLGFHLMFLGELWNYGLTPFSVIPYWSLAYEFWFYLLLAASLMRPGRARTLSLTAVILIMGPRIWLLLPCWLLGVWAYRFTQNPARHPAMRQAWPRARIWASLAFGLALALWLSSGFDAYLRSGSEAFSGLVRATLGERMRLDYSRWFLADYGVALLFTAALLIAARSPQTRDRGVLARAIHWLAPHTFGVYLLHYTLISFSAATIPQALREGVRSALLAALIISVALGLSVLFDRTRGVWAGFLTDLARLLPGLHKPPPVTKPAP